MYCSRLDRMPTIKDGTNTAFGGGKKMKKKKSLPWMLSLVVIMSSVAVIVSVVLVNVQYLVHMKPVRNHQVQRLMNYSIITIMMIMMTRRISRIIVV